MVHVLARLLCWRISRYVAEAVAAVPLDIGDTVPSTHPCRL